jgi:RNA-directed DNA polymerase
VLANIFLHHVLDEWFEHEARPRMAGPCTLVRFADDFVMTFKNHHDAKRVLDVLGKRLGRYGLSLHPDKTRFIDFRPERQGGTHADCKEPPFDFLGFTHTWMKSKKGKNVVRQRTAKSRLARALVAINDWCRHNRHQPLADQRKRLSAKLVGHYAYYGITGNIAQLGRHFRQTAKSWRKWLARRTRPHVLSWDSFNAILARHPLPHPGSSITTPRPTKLSREEPDAGNLHVRVCGGRGWKHPRLPGRGLADYASLIRPTARK